jgi:hypothetical protein
VANFRYLVTPKKNRLAYPTKGFLRLKKRIAISREKKKLEVARFRQCVPLGRQIYAGFQKEITSPPGQSPFIAN